MKQGTYIVCNKVNAPDTDGYLFLLGKGNAKNRVKKALGIKVNYKLFKNNWNKVEQRYMSGMPNYKILNADIQNRLSQLRGEVETETENKILQVSKNTSSFLSYWQATLDEITIIGTRTKYEQQKIKFEKFLQSIGKTDIMFGELTPEFITQYQQYLKISKDPKRLAPNQRNHYLKAVQTVIKKKMKKEPYLFNVNPFVSIEYEKKEETNRRVLHNEEYKKIIFTQIEDKELALTRDAFLFMVFAGGMRVADMLTLRWNTIKSNYIPDNQNSTIINYVPVNKDYEPRIDYVMLKRRKEKAPTELSFYTCKILMGLMGRISIGAFNDIIDYNGTYPDFIKTLFKNNGVIYETYWEKIWDLNREIEKHIVNGFDFEHIEYKGLTINRDNSEAIKLIDSLEQAKKQLMDRAVEISCVHFNNRIVNNNGKHFIFPFIDNKEFEGLPESEKEFKSEIAQSKQLITLIYNAEKKFNTRLKTLSKYLGFTEKVNPHAARHTTAQRLISEGENLFTIQQNLGHSSAAITENYTKGKDFKIKDKENSMKKIGNKTDFI